MELTNIIIGDEFDSLDSYLQAEIRKGYFEKDNKYLEELFSLLFESPSDKLRFYFIKNHFYSDYYIRSLDYENLDRVTERSTTQSFRLHGIYGILSRLSTVTALKVLKFCYVNGIVDVISDRDVTYKECAESIGLENVPLKCLLSIIPENEIEFEKIKETIQKRVYEDKENREFFSTRLKMNPLLWSRKYYKELLFTIVESYAKNLKKGSNIKKGFIYIDMEKIIKTRKNSSPYFILNRQAYNYNHSGKGVDIDSIREEISNHVNGFLGKVFENKDDNIVVVNVLEGFRQTNVKFTHHKKVVEFIDQNFKEYMNKLLSPRYEVRGRATRFPSNISCEDLEKVIENLELEENEFCSFYNYIPSKEFNKLNSRINSDVLKKKILLNADFKITGFEFDAVWAKIGEIASENRKIDMRFFMKYFKFLKLFCFTSIGYVWEKTDIDLISNTLCTMYSKEERFIFLEEVLEKQYYKPTTYKLKIQSLVVLLEEQELIEKFIRKVGSDAIDFSKLDMDDNRDINTIVFDKIVYHDNMLISKEFAKELGMLFLTDCFE